MERREILTEEGRGPASHRVSKDTGEAMGAKDYGNSQILCAGTWPLPKLGPQALSGKQRKYGLMLGLVFWNESKPLRHKKPRGASLGDSWDAQVESLSRQNKGTAASSKTGKDSLVRSI